MITVTALACPGCHASPLVPHASADVAALAAAWGQDPACTVPADRLHDYLTSLLAGATRVGFLRCAACGLEVAEPAVAWPEDGYPRQAYYLAFDHQQALALLSGPPLRLLELGAGDGLFLAEAGRLGHTAVGLDFVGEAVEAARAKGLTVIRGDVHDLSAHLADDQRFDVIAMFQILEHVRDPDHLLAELSRVAAPGARVMIGVPSHTRFSRVIPNADQVGGADYWDWPPQHVLRWTPTALAAFLQRHGWTVEVMRPEPFSLAGAAATLAAIDGRGARWYANPILRRLHTARRMLSPALARRRTEITGIRLFACARRD